jgi:hypothetical protein
MTKINNVYINNEECAMPSVFTQSPIFQVIPVNNKDERKKRIEYIAKERTKNEAHSFSGYRLDLIRDYPLFHILLMELQKQQSSSININLDKVIKQLGVNKARKENRKDTYDRIWKFSECIITVLKIKGDKSIPIEQLPEVKTRLIHEINKIDEKNNYEVIFPEKINELIALFQYQKINLGAYKKLKYQSSMAIYLAIRSHAFISKKSLNLTLNTLKVHYKESNKDKHTMQDLDIGFQELIEKQFIKSYLETNTAKGDVTYKIQIS